MRRAWLSAAAIVCVSCGGAGPLAPSPTANGAASGALPSGAYTLTVSMATNGTGGFSFCTSVTAGGSQPVFAAVFVPTPVHVTHAGNVVTIAPDDPAATFRMQLQLAGASATGTASGQYGSGGATITVSGMSAGEPAAATGQVGATLAAGVMSGTLTVQGLSCTNNAHGWQLKPRL